MMNVFVCNARGEGVVYLKLISESVAGIFSNNKDLYYSVSDDYGNREYRKYRGETVEITEEEYLKSSMESFMKL